MASQSGIECSEALSAFLGTCRGGGLRLVKVVISSTPSLELESSEPACDDWEKDWDRLVPQQLQADLPCFLLYRLDERDSSSSFLWLLISWSPDGAPTRQKMLYASTKATFKKQFGAGQIQSEYFANTPEEVTLKGYKRHLETEAAPGPLSRAEEEMKAIKETESRPEVSVDTKHNTLSGLAFPFQSEAQEAITQFHRGEGDYLQLAIAMESETVVLKELSSCSVEQLPGKVPEDAARYHLFRFKHNYEGDYLESVVFIYSMPGYSVSIKERMMYSSCKNAVVEVVLGLGVLIEKSVEVDGGRELSELYLKEELHPIKSLNKPKFAKPQGPSRGARRITKTPS